MRIVSGKFKGKIFKPEKGIKARPTTDMAKESLFNKLSHDFHFEDLKVLDLYTGTGNISFEFYSRGSKDITCVDISGLSGKFIVEFSRENKMDGIKFKKTDAFRFIQKTSESFDIIFADPPYGFKKIDELPNTVFESGILKPDGLLIVEHGQENNFEDHPRFIEQKNYSRVNFSFFK